MMGTADTRSPTRIVRLRASNYRSLGDDLEVTFGDLTALVGPNGSGKSNVLDVLRFLRESLTLGLEPAISKRLGITRLRRVAPTKPRSVKVGIDLVNADWRASYDIQLNATSGSYRVEREMMKLAQLGAVPVEDEVVLDVVKGQTRTAPSGLSPRATQRELVLPTLAGDVLLRPVVEALRALRVHSIFPRELSQPQPIGSTPPLDDTGSNWCAVLRTLDADAKRELTIALEQVSGDIVDLRVDSGGGYYTAEFEHRVPNATRPMWFSAGQESDGTLRLAGILTALLQSPAPPLIAIEEPELTINPGLLPLLYDYIQATSRRCQVVLTTHSPDLLDLIPLEDLRVVSKTDGLTTVGLVSKAQRDSVKAALQTPGELMRTGQLVANEQLNILDSLQVDLHRGT